MILFIQKINNRSNNILTMRKTYFKRDEKDIREDKKKKTCKKKNIKHISIDTEPKIVRTPQYLSTNKTITPEQMEFINAKLTNKKQFKSQAGLQKIMEKECQHQYINHMLKQQNLDKENMEAGKQKTYKKGYSSFSKLGKKREQNFLFVREKNLIQTKKFQLEHKNLKIEGKSLGENSVYERIQPTSHSAIHSFSKDARPSNSNLFSGVKQQGAYIRTPSPSFSTHLTMFVESIKINYMNRSEHYKPVREYDSSPFENKKIGKKLKNRPLSSNLHIKEKWQRREGNMRTDRSNMKKKQGRGTDRNVGKNKFFFLTCNK